MLNLFENLTKRFRNGQGELTHDEFLKITRRFSPFYEDPNTILFILQASGYPIEETALGYRLSTYFTPWEKGRYCVIDIETNGSKPGYSQVIELGAVMIEDGKISDRFESLVACAYLPKHISELTGIEPSDLAGAPSRKEALTALRTFMGDSVFVAHNVNFDYSFLGASFQRFGLGSIGNQSLCTIDLAKRTITSEKYGLAYLNESLGLGMDRHHRAYGDALATAKILMKSFENIPDNVKSVDDLIRFSKTSTSKAKKMSTSKQEFRNS